MNCEIGDDSDKMVSRKLAFGFWGRERHKNFTPYFNYSLPGVPVVNFTSEIVNMINVIAGRSIHPLWLD